MGNATEVHQVKVEYEVEEGGKDAGGRGVPVLVMGDFLEQCVQSGFDGSTVKIYFQLIEGIS